MDLKISIIIPIYNCERYLNKCINSVIDQTYRNIEILLINDASTDNSLKICEKYKNDKRINVINQVRNVGVSEARNIGIRKATGNYIMFVDSDDWIDNNCVEKLVNELKNYEYDVIIFPYIREYRNIKPVRKIFSREKIFDKEEVEKQILKKLIGPNNEELHNPSEMEKNNAVWGKLYKKKLIKDIFFTSYNDIIGEDLLFNIKVFCKAKIVKYIETTMYHYNKENISSLTNTEKDEIMQRWKNLYKNIEYEIENENYMFLDKKQLKDNLNRRIIINQLTITQQVFFRRISILKRLKELKLILDDDLYKNKYSTVDKNYMDVKWKIFYTCCEKKKILFLSILLVSIKILRKRG